MGTAGEIVIWMVLAALVGFATGWALRSVVANRARARLSDRLEEKRREAQELREELRHLRGGDEEDVDIMPGGMPGGAPDWGPARAGVSLHQTSRKGDRRARRGRARPARGSREPTGEQRQEAGTTRTMRLDEEWSGRTPRTRRAGQARLFEPADEA